MRGRKPKPTKSKVIQGTFRKDRALENEVQPDLCIPSPPTHLNQDASVEWGRISTELYACGLLSQIDRTALAAYCQVYARWVEAEEKLKTTGIIIKTTHGNIIQSPLIGIANKALELMHKYLIEFGMTPSSRTRVGAKKPDSSKTKKQGFGGL